MNTRARTPTIPQLAAQIESLEAQATTLTEQAQQLAEQLKFARGTKRDMTPEAAAADERSTKVLYDLVVHMLRQRPMRHHEIVEAVGGGVNENRIKGVITQIKRDRIGYVNLGNERIGLHFIPDEDVLRRLRARHARR